jgi:hypothetical protein
MTTERETTRLVRAWLREADDDSAIRVVDAALAVIEHRPQRRTWRPLRRIAGSSARGLLGVAAVLALVVIVAMLGLPWRPGPVTAPGLTPTPTPPPSPSPSATERPAPIGTQVPTQSGLAAPSAAAFFPESGVLPAGRVYLTRAGISMSLDLPTADWISAQGFEIRRDPLATANGIDLRFWDTSPTNTYADPCAAAPRDPPAGSSLEEITSAVAAAPGTQLLNNTPTDVTIGGHAGKQITLGIPATLPCPAGGDGFRLWYAGDPATGRYPFVAGSTIWVWIIDVDGTLVWVDAETYRGAPGSVIDDLHRVVESIQFQ